MLKNPYDAHPTVAVLAEIKKLELMLAMERVLLVKQALVGEMMEVRIEKARESLASRFDGPVTAVVDVRNNITQLMLETYHIVVTDYAPRVGGRWIQGDGYYVGVNPDSPLHTWLSNAHLDDDVEAFLIELRNRSVAVDLNTKFWEIPF